MKLNMNGAPRMLGFIGGTRRGAERGLVGEEMDVLRHEDVGGDGEAPCCLRVFRTVSFAAAVWRKG